MDDPDAACRPPRNTTYLAVGQDLFSIESYVATLYNASLHAYPHNPAARRQRQADFWPAAAMTYTDAASLVGLGDPADYGSGVEYADGLLESAFPGGDVGLQIGLWLGGSAGCRDVLSGAGGADDRIRELAEYLRDCSAPKIFLRVGYEFDNPSFGYSDDPSVYASAFRKIVDEIRAVLPSHMQGKVLFVWHSWAAPRATGVSLDDFYPGDGHVDWVGVSIFQQVFPAAADAWYWAGDAGSVEEVLDYARGRGKPTMIAESAPFGGIGVDTWRTWFVPVLDLIDRHDISMWSYIACDWDSQPMWRGVGFGDTRIPAGGAVGREWAALLEGKSNYTGRAFLGGGSLGSCDRDVAVGGVNGAVWRSFTLFNYGPMFYVALTTSALLIIVVSKIRRRINDGGGRTGYSNIA